MVVVSEANARINGMGLIAEGGEHFGGFLDGIGGDEDFFLDG